MSIQYISRYDNQEEAMKNYKRQLANVELSNNFYYTLENFDRQILCICVIPQSKYVEKPTYYIFDFLRTDAR